MGIKQFFWMVCIFLWDEEWRVGGTGHLMMVKVFQGDIRFFFLVRPVLPTGFAQFISCGFVIMNGLVDASDFIFFIYLAYVFSFPLKVNALYWFNRIQATTVFIIF